MREAFISAYGDRVTGDSLLALRFVRTQTYAITLPPEPVFVHATTLTPNRLVVLERQADSQHAHLHTYNLRDGYYPGADLRVRVYTLDDPDLLAMVSTVTGATLNCTLQQGAAPGTTVVRFDTALDTAQAQVIVQPYAASFRIAETTFLQANVCTIRTLITRTPPVPIETNIEVAIVRHLGPLRAR